MKKFLNSFRISRKLPLVIAFTTGCAIVVTAFTDYLNTRDVITAESQDKLKSVSHLNGRRIVDLIEAIDRDITLRSGSAEVTEALKAFSEAFSGYDKPKDSLQKVYIQDNPHPTGSKDLLVSPPDQHPYHWVHGKYHPEFNALQDSMQYYDVFLFDTQGNLVYSVFKELDYATNMLTGEWRDSGLAESFRKANAAAPTDPTVFVDFSAYGPSHGAPAAFISRPVFDRDGTRLGVLGFQMPVDELNATVAKVIGLGTTGEAFLLGSDGLMRSDPDSSQGNDILSTRLDNPEFAAGFQGNSGFAEFIDWNGNNVLSYYEPVNLLGTTWIAVSKQDAAEVFAPLQAAKLVALISAVVLLAITTLVSFLIARGISVPLTRVRDAVKAVAAGRFDIEVPSRERGDEVGEIAQALDRFRQQLADAETNMREIAFQGAAFEVAGSPMMIVDDAFRITRMNASASRLMQDRATDFAAVVNDFAPSGLIGTSFDRFEVIPRSVIAGFARRENLPYKTSVTVGEASLGLLVDAVTDAEDRLLGFVIEWRDETRQRQTQTLMRAIDTNQSRLEIGLDGLVKGGNEVFAEISGRDIKDLTGLQARKLIRTEQQSTGGDIWERVRDGDTVFDRFRIDKPEGYSLVEGSLSPVLNDRGKSIGFLLLGIDVTADRKAAIAAEERQKAMAEAQALVVTQLEASLTRLSQGDLGAVIETQFSEEYEQLRLNFNDAVGSLSEALTEVVVAAQLISGEARAIDAGTIDLAKRTETQAATLEQTAAALSELTQSVKNTSSDASNASQTAKNARENAESSGEIVYNAVAAMEEIERSSREISKITEVIDNIAFQTNLLALNAGVEAARAGDAGRGFAVVASEVRALAQRTSNAAREINELISKSEEHVDSGVSLVNNAGAALTSIVSSVREISNNVATIAHAASDQSAALAEINIAMEQLDQATQHNAAMVEETTAACSNLSAQADGLAETTGRFQFGQPGETASSPARNDFEPVRARAG